MDNNRSRRILGILTLTIFLLVFLSVSGGYSSIGREAQDLYYAVWGRLSGNTGTLNPRTLVRQQVVQEESAIIDVVDTVSPSVVSIIVRTVDFDIFSGPLTTESGIGTGFIVDPNGLIITNSHVVDNRDGLYSVVLKDGTTYEVEQIHLDEMTDLAIIEISARDLPAVELGDSDEIRVGQQAIAIGNALGRFSNTVTVGVVSGIARELTATSSFGSNPKTYEGAIQTDAALNPGNSGGPLLNSAGQVVGINVATTRGADNIGFAIPVNTLRPILETFFAEGRIIRPYLGVSYTMVTPEIAAIRRMPEGAYISRVIAESPASKTGMQRGDVIVSFDRKELGGNESLSSLIASKKVGDRVDVVIDRNGESVNMTVTLEAAPESM